MLNWLLWAPEDAEFLRSLGFEGTDAELLRLGANVLTDATTGLRCSVDGVDLGNLFNYRDESTTTFPVVFGEGVFGFSAGDERTGFTDGFWLMLAPLPPGEHEIVFSQSLTCTPETCFGLEFSFGGQTIYHLTVE